MKETERMGWDGMEVICWLPGLRLSLRLRFKSEAGIKAEDKIQQAGSRLAEWNWVVRFVD